MVSMLWGGEREGAVGRTVYCLRRGDAICVRGVGKNGCPGRLPLFLCAAWRLATWRLHVLTDRADGHSRRCRSRINR
jgi:hypothetical protein